MNKQDRLTQLRREVLELEEELRNEQNDWHDSGCVIDEPENDWNSSWEESARHWSEDDDWYSSSC